MIQALARRIAETIPASGSMATRTAAVIRNGTVWAAVVSVHRRWRARSERSSARRRQWTPATSGRTASVLGAVAMG